MKFDFFADDDDVERQEAQVAAAGEDRRADLLLPLAWQMRQRDSHRAISLADEVERDLGEVSLSPSQQSAAIARLQLIRAEVHWLHGEPELA